MAPVGDFSLRLGADPPPMPNTCEACRNASDCTVEANRLIILAPFDLAGIDSIEAAMSAFGTKQTSQSTQLMSAFEGKADMASVAVSLKTLAVMQPSFRSQMWYPHRVRPSARLAGQEAAGIHGGSGLGVFS